jgi:hypothetical protein
MLGDMAEDQKVGLLKIRPASSVRIITEFIKNDFSLLISFKPVMLVNCG